MKKLSITGRQTILVILAYRHSGTTWSRRHPGKSGACLGIVGIRALRDFAANSTL